MEPYTDTITETFWSRWRRWALSQFYPLYRIHTEMEIAQAQELAQLRDQVAALTKHLDDAKHAIKLRQQEIEVKDLELEGQTKVIAMHEARWDAEAKFHNARAAALKQQRP